MRRHIEGLGLNYDDIKVTEEELEQLQAAAQQPEPPVQVAQIRAETDIKVQQLKNQMAELKTMLEAQLRGTSIEQAREAVETQGLANVTQEIIRQEGAVDLQDRAAALDPTNPLINPTEEPTVDEALDELGI
jgi:hypothetical protein